MRRWEREKETEREREIRRERKTEPNLTHGTKGNMQKDRARHAHFVNYFMLRIVRIVIRRKKIGNCICYLSCDVAYKEVDSKTSLWTIYVITISFSLDTVSTNV